jgi:hypothetical protein
MDSPLEVCGMGFFVSIFFVGSFDLAMVFVLGWIIYHFTGVFRT